MKLIIDADTCMGHGLCYYTAPDLLTDDEGGFGVVIGDGDVPPSQRAIAEQTESLCPERALHLIGDESTRD
ncbi:ferredoxin [Mycobacterium sp.]|uniref:ferredoxin n=1 Tax=Mycobacterium sp. TaxID=1785 RepID=UPI003C758F8F